MLLAAIGRRSRARLRRGDLLGQRRIDAGVVRDRGDARPHVVHRDHACGRASSACHAPTAPAAPSRSMSRHRERCRGRHRRDRRRLRSTPCCRHLRVGCAVAIGRRGAGLAATGTGVCAWPRSCHACPRRDLVDRVFAGPRHGRAMAIDAERIEHRLRLEHEQRGLARHHAVRLRQRDLLDAVFTLAGALELADRERGPQPRHEAVRRRSRRRRA